GLWLAATTPAPFSFPSGRITVLATAVIPVIQAMVGGALLRRCSAFTDSLDDGKSVLTLLTVGGVGTGVLGACLDLVLATVTHPNNYGGLLFDGFCRWAGTILGVAFFTPLLMAWWPQANPSWRRRRAAASLCLLVSFSGVWLLVEYTSARERATDQQKLSEIAIMTGAQIEKDVTLYVDALASMQSLMMSDIPIDRISYEEIANRTRQRLPGVQALNWVSRVTRQQREKFESDLITRQMDDLGIKERQSGSWVKAADRDDYFPVTWVAPVIENRLAIGFDLLSDPVRRMALEQARDGGRFVFSRPLHLVTGGIGLLAMLPVYQHAAPVDTVGNRRSAMTGIILGVLRPQELASDAMTISDRNHVHFWLVDETEPGQSEILVSNVASKPEPYQLPGRGLFGVPSTLQSIRPVDMGERKWVVRIAPVPEFLEDARQTATWYVLLAAVAFTGFASGAVLVATGRETVLIHIAEERADALAKIERINHRFREEAEKRFNVIVDNIGEAVILMDDQGRIETFNQAAEQAFGYHAADIIGQPANILVTAPETYRLTPGTDKFSVLKAGEKSRRRWEIAASRCDGSPFPAEMTIDELTGLESARYLVIIHDISHRKEIERSLRESERRFRDLAGSASDWFWETDPDYNLTFVSERIGAILGVKAAEIQGLSYFDLGLDDLPEVARAHRADITRHAAFRDLVFHVGPSGDAKDSKFIRLSGIPLFDRNGTFTGYRGIGADITREMAAERRANVALQQMADAIDSVGDAIAVDEGAARRVICNAAFKTIFGEFGHLLQPGMAFGDMLDMGHDLNVFHTGGEVYETWKQRRLEQHLEATGLPFISRRQAGRWF
ncbi:MAG: PAS domain S-box protein, partial [Methanobacterium sp.]|nr:PAS domain S-box protein [Methanobacterium sp.]